MPGIASLLADADVVTSHETTVALPPERALEVVLATPAAPDALARVLLRLRGLPVGRLTLGGLFPELEHTPSEAVYGFAGKPWLPLPGRFYSFHEPQAGTVRIALAFRAEPLPDGGSRVVTETRVAAVDERARRAFGRYWRFVRPFSGLVRRRWLAAVERRAAAARGARP